MNTARKRERDARAPATCRDCGQKILWVTWPKSGKRMPVNAEPQSAPYGQIVVSYGPAGNKLIAERARYGNAQGRKLYESHFATCTGERATEMRKNKPPQGSARRVA